jgi:hypothetical protein
MKSYCERSMARASDVRICSVFAPRLQLEPEFHMVDSSIKEFFGKSPSDYFN